MHPCNTIGVSSQQEELYYVGLNPSCKWSFSPNLLWEEERENPFLKKRKAPYFTYRDKRTHSLSRRQAGAVISRQCLV